MKVLMTDGTSSSARQTLYGLDPDWQIDVCAPSRLAQCRFSSIANRFWRCPPIGSDPAGYLRFLLRRLRDERYDLLLPTHEEIYLLSRFRDRFEDEASLAVPTLQTMRHMLGKVGFAEKMRMLSLPVPDYEILTSISDLERHDAFPYYLKLNYSTAGRGVRSVSGPAQRSEAIAEFRRSELFAGERMQVLAQRPASGRMCVAQAVFQQGQLVAAHCAMLLEAGVGGSPLLRISVQHPAVLQHLRRLGESLQWHGAMFLEYFFDPQSEKIEYIECNPRIGEPVNAMLSGVDLVSALVAVSRGEPNASYGMYGETVPGVRSHAGFIGLIGRAMAGASRRELIEHCQMMAQDRGIYEDAENEITRPKDDPLSRIPAAFVMSRLLARPAIATRLVETTVKHYALPNAAVQAIDRMDERPFDRH